MLNARAGAGKYKKGTVQENKGDVKECQLHEDIVDNRNVRCTNTDVGLPEAQLHAGEETK